MAVAEVGAGTPYTKETLSDMPKRFAPARAPGFDKASTGLHNLCQGVHGPDVVTVSHFRPLLRRYK